jgi:hypothetical protein
MPRLNYWDDVDDHLGERLLAIPRAQHMPHDEIEELTSNSCPRCLSAN